jgi:ATP-dependent DNA ligase
MMRKTAKRKPSLPHSYAPMEATPVATLPTGGDWQYEPKWDGFRCLVFRAAGQPDLRSKAGRPLGRYFPDVIDVVRALPVGTAVFDSELVVPTPDGLSFDDLLQRIHPAASRVMKLAAAHPAVCIVFDLLADPRGKSLVHLPLRERRTRLEQLARSAFTPMPATPGGVRGAAVVLSPATCDRKEAARWLARGTSGWGGLDGVIAKALDLPYQSGTRKGMQKVKQLRTADCVVGGFRYASKGGLAGSLLLGLYDDDGLLHHVGFTSAMTASVRAEVTPRLVRLIKPPGFTGRAPGGPSRWSTRRTDQWEPLAPKLVVEVQYDHFSDGRFRHGTSIARWRPDKAPRQCTLDQIAPTGRSAMVLLDRSGLSDGRAVNRRRQGR